MRTKLFLCGALLFAGLTQSISAAGITGTFDMSGIITVTTTDITWNSDVSPNLAEFFTLSGGTGAFASANGQTAIDNLDISVEPVGMLFSDQPFITFTQDPSLPGLDINFIFEGTGGSAGCSAAPAVNETCTLPNPGGSPFTFTDDSGGTADAKFTFSGVTSDGLSDWTAIFTAQFGEPYQTVLAAFGPGGSGSVSNSYSATTDVNVVVTSQVPEPSMFILMGAGLTTIGLLKRRRRG
jgi:hypothetical protein